MHDAWANLRYWRIVANVHWQYGGIGTDLNIVADDGLQIGVRSHVGRGACQFVVGEHDPMTDEAVASYVYIFANETMRRDSCLRSDGAVRLYLNKRSNECVFWDRRSVNVACLLYVTCHAVCDCD